MDTINLDDLTPTRPYMVKAMFEWLEDNHLTPYIMVDTTLPHVVVPTEFIQDNRIVLSIASRSTHQFHMDNEFINFQGRFGGVSKRNLGALLCGDGYLCQRKQSFGYVF